MSIIKTVCTDKENEDSITSPYPYSFVDKNDTITFTVRGLMPERSIEDRDVYINIETKQENKPNKAKHNEVHTAFWLRGEKAIELGLALIKGGSFALQTNMIQHQSNWCENKLSEFIRDERVDIVKITEINHNPANYGSGFHTINLKPIWQQGKAPKYQEDFNFDIVLYYTSTEEFTKNIKLIIQNVEWSIVHMPEGT